MNPNGLAARAPTRFAHAVPGHCDRGERGKLSLLIQFGRLALAQHWGKQRLQRTPEPNTITEEPGQILQYDRAPTSKLAILYACGLEIIHRARPEVRGGSALDLACGPGHFTLALRQHLGYDSVAGIDLSSRMIETARRNAEPAGLCGRATFAVADITRLEGYSSCQYDLTTFLHGAHHLPTLQAASGVLRAMDRITKPEGLVVVMDLVRLRTADLTERYVSAVARDYLRRDLRFLYDEFRHSMFAAWTVDEFRHVIPRASNRLWCHLAPAGLPTAQIILGLPARRIRVFLRSGLPWPRGQTPVPTEQTWEWKLLRWSLALGSRWTVAALEPREPC
jgi:ubiquinone/menaquinone biosynthesis C-methylase UbiE